MIHSDGVYHVIVDQKPFIKGHLLEDLTPSIILPKEIDDPADQMPEDWDEREMYVRYRHRVSRDGGVDQCRSFFLGSCWLFKRCIHPNG